MAYEWDESTIRRRLLDSALRGEEHLVVQEFVTPGSDSYWIAELRSRAPRGQERLAIWEGGDDIPSEHASLRAHGPDRVEALRELVFQAMERDLRSSPEAPPEK
jgi:hypothetical protein